MFFFVFLYLKAFVQINRVPQNARIKESRDDRLYVEPKAQISVRSAIEGGGQTSRSQARQFVFV